MVRVTKLPQERRKEILSAALSLFIQNGYEGTAVSDIVKKLNVSQGLFYYYFKSKEEVFMVAMEQYAEALVGRIMSILADVSRPIYERIVVALGTLESIAREMEPNLVKGLANTESFDLHMRLSLHAAQQLVQPISELIKEIGCKETLTTNDTSGMAAFCTFGILGLLHGNPAEDNIEHQLDLTAVVGLVSQVLGISPEVFKEL